MMFFKSLKYDLKNGCAVSFKKYLIVVLMTLVFCIDYLVRADRLCEFQKISYKPSVADYLFFIFAGRDEYKPSLHEGFSFPAVWTLFFVFILFMTLIYPFKDLNGFGKFILINTKSRKIWWYSKCCWVIISMAIVNIIVLLVVSIFGLITKSSFSAEVTPYCIALSNHNFNYFGYKNFYLGLRILLPFFIMVALSMLQMTISLLIKPNVSFMLTIAHMISAAFYKTPFLFANFAMLLRNDAVIENGFGVPMGIITSFIVSVVSMVVGSIIFSRYDILNKE